MSSAAEAELVSLFIIACKCVEIRQTLIKMGWSQQPTHIQVDNTTAVGVMTDNIVPKKLKAWACYFGGYGVEQIKNKFVLIGRQANSITQNLLLRTIPASVTLVKDHSVKGYHKHLIPTNHIL